MTRYSFWVMIASLVYSILFPISHILDNQPFNWLCICMEFMYVLCFIFALIEEIINLKKKREEKSSMAKIEYMICDRCKRKIGYEDFYELKVCEVPKEPKVTGVIKFDICEDCRKKFYEFLKEVKTDG